MDGSPRDTDIFTAAAVTTGVVIGTVLGFWRGRRTAPGMLSSGGAFGALNRPTAGPRFNQVLPMGAAPLQLYSLATPNGQKVTVLLEELGVPYDAHMISIFKGEQFGSGFTALNPNSKIPLLLDREGPGGQPLSVFESSAILLYLAEKYRSPLLPSDPRVRVDCLQWLFFLHGAAPFFGQFGHFTRYAPGAQTGGQIPYAVHRYTTETKRLLAVLERQLSDGRKYILGNDFSIADIAWFPWVLCCDKFYNARETLAMDADYPAMMAWLDRCSSRPAAAKGMQVNSPSAPPELQNYSSVGASPNESQKQ